MKTLLFIGLAAVALATPVSVKAQQFDGASIHKAQYSRYSYVHRKSYRQTRPGYIGSCYCYSVSSSAFVYGSFQVARRNSWNAAVAVRNNYSLARDTCPGFCKRAWPLRRVQNPRTIIRRQPGVAVRSPHISTGHAKCRRKFGSRAYATSYRGRGHWNCYTGRSANRPNWAAGHAACKRRFGYRSRALSVAQGGRWNCLRPRAVRSPPPYTGGRGLSPGRTCIYGIC